MKGCHERGRLQLKYRWVIPSFFQARFHLILYVRKRAGSYLGFWWMSSWTKSCPCCTCLTQKLSQGGHKLFQHLSSHSCTLHLLPWVFWAEGKLCFSSLQLLWSKGASFIILGFYSTLQAQIVTRSDSLKLLMTVDTGKAHTSSSIFFSSLPVP